MRTVLELVLTAFGAMGVVYAVLDEQWTLLALTVAALALIAAWTVLRRGIELSPTLWDWSLKIRYSNKTPAAAAKWGKALWGDDDQHERLGYGSIGFIGREERAKRNELRMRQAPLVDGIVSNETSGQPDAGQHLLVPDQKALHEKLGQHQGPALVAPLEALTRRRGWPGWAFAVALTSEGVEVEGAPTPDAAGTVNVSLGRTPVGIYNNAGKRFLDEQWPLNEGSDKEEHRKAYADAMRLSRIAHDAFLNPSASRVVKFAEGTPLRWASAGVLPIANWRGKEWVVLFLRDIRPKGWNLANGASENEDERYNVSRLAHREFCEELLVLNRDPDPDPNRNPSLTTADLTVRPFSFDAFAGQSMLESRKFALEHEALRDREDGLSLRWPQSTGDAIHVTTTRTRWRVRVSGGRRTAEPVRNIIPALNPLERGLEMTQIVRFHLRDEDHLLDGEILEDVGGRRILARRPVGLISLDFIKEAINENTWKEASRDRRLLPPIPGEALHIFSTENHLRRARLADLARGRPANGQPSKEELHHQTWYAEFSHVYGEDAGQLDQARLLCPVVWKTLEIAIRTGSLS